MMRYNRMLRGRVVYCRATNDHLAAQVLLVEQANYSCFFKSHPIDHEYDYLFGPTEK